ncbi:hypothetical protein [Ralstonia solanacearum]|uniref:hypothetical protein n=1 Tax=Ralstonia solanacearum TaxID=305 RepID=UPI0005C613FF|nr:hypothetical protein [Ralstonia solanacearum]ATJ88344.1 hypothetical protein CDC59_18900 [Ralstonia solanacearum]MBB6593740.1 hypothetical protein [Ralstonia solanacearum]MBB6597952.1 hypothetical protein [Ralstonia solanacearum]MDB0544226.1 hypothetical protein [Ralstonia solanacearum]MDB0553540.1 hypothetical protein [Ralstonia solanacearum]
MASVLRRIGTALAHWLEWTLFRIARLASRIPVFTAVGLLLLGGAVLVWTVWEPRAAAQVARIQKELGRKHAANPAPVRQVSTLETVAAQLEPPLNRSVIGSDIFAGFTAQGARVDQVVFSKDAEEAAAEEVRSVRLQATVIGLYPAIKAGLADLLQKHPSLALESMTFTKNGGTEQTVTADLAFVLWYRGH